MIVAVAMAVTVLWLWFCCGSDYGHGYGRDYGRDHSCGHGRDCGCGIVEATLISPNTTSKNLLILKLGPSMLV